MAHHIFSIDAQEMSSTEQHRASCGLYAGMGSQHCRSAVLLPPCVAPLNLRACLCRNLVWSSPGAMPSSPGAGGSSSIFSTSPSKPFSHPHAMATHLPAMFMGAVCTSLVLYKSHARQMGHATPVQCLLLQACSRGLSSSERQKSSVCWSAPQHIALACMLLCVRLLQ